MSRPSNPAAGSSVPPQTENAPVANGHGELTKTDVERSEKKNLTLLMAGTAFVMMSAIITRRGVARRQRWARPTYFQQNDQHPEQKVDLSLEALEALSVATVNVFSWSVFFSGGMLWALHISNLEELRSRLRVRLGITEDEQKGSQTVVRQWIEAAKPWNVFKSKKPTAETIAPSEEGPGVAEPVKLAKAVDRDAREG
jgi:hypothetical protein